MNAEPFVAAVANIGHVTIEEAAGMIEMAAEGRTQREIVCYVVYFPSYHSCEYPAIRCGNTEHDPHSWQMRR